MTERGGVRGGRSSAKVGPAEGRARGVSPDAAGSEVGSGVTAVPTRPAPQGRGVLCLRLLQSACLGPPPSPRPPGVASPRSALVLCDDHFCHGPGSAVKAWLVPSARPRRRQHGHAGIPLQEDLCRPLSARRNTACTTQFWPARSSSEPPGGRWTQMEPQGPRCLPRPFPSSQQPHVLRRSSRLRLWRGLLPGIHPLPSPTPEGARAGVRSSVWAGQEGLPDPGARQRWPLLAPRSAALPPGRSQDVETESHWPIVVTAGCHGQERAVLGSQGRHSVHIAPSRRGPSPGPLGGGL